MSENSTYYKLIIAYDGTNYAGWQVQKSQRSIANVLENTFFNVFKKRITLVGASRTDAGVHAEGQVATFVTNLTIDTNNLKKILNKSLPPSIVIRTLETTDASFHPRYHVVQKTYWYHFFLDQPMPFVQRYGCYLTTPLDLSILEKALQQFVGTHDFRSFCSGTDLKNTVRTIQSIDVTYNDLWGAYRITIQGKGFLRYMIRRIVGASFQVAQGKFSTELLQKALLEKNPHQKFCTAPAHGLLLAEISYQKN